MEKKCIFRQFKNNLFYISLFFQILALLFEAGLKQEKCTIFVEKQGR